MPGLPIGMPNIPGMPGIGGMGGMGGQRPVDPYLSCSSRHFVTMQASNIHNQQQPQQVSKYSNRSYVFHIVNESRGILFDWSLESLIMLMYKLLIVWNLADKCVKHFCTSFWKFGKIASDWCNMTILTFSTLRHKAFWSKKVLTVNVII